jgi:hypothetical protein
LKSAVAKAKPDISAAISLLEKLMEIEPSMERASLLGSAHKRLALIAASEHDAATEAAEIAAMKESYERAEQIGRDNKLEDFFYPALNRLAAELALAGSAQLDPQAVAAIRAALDSMVRDKPEFWSVVGQTELRLYESLSRGDLADECPRIIAAYDDLHLRIQTEWMWSSVYDQAQFVLPKYAKGASAKEQEAARRVIDRLGELSGRSQTQPAATVAADRPPRAPARRRSRTRRRQPGRGR